jgi:hypothetical protein
MQSSKLRFPAVLQESLSGLGRQRPAEEEALNLVAHVLLQHFKLSIRVDAFDDDTHAKAVSESDRRHGDGGIVRVGGGRALRRDWPGPAGIIGKEPADQADTRIQCFQTANT